MGMVCKLNLSISENHERFSLMSHVGSRITLDTGDMEMELFNYEKQQRLECKILFQTIVRLMPIAGQCIWNREQWVNH